MLCLQVLSTGVGIPITLCLVYCIVGRKAGINIDMIGAPGHFVCQAWDDPDDGTDAYFVDVFGGGSLLTLDELLQSPMYRHLQQAHSFQVAEEHLRPITLRTVFTRILNNLVCIYREKANLQMLIPLIAMQLLVTDHESTLDQHKQLRVLEVILYREMLDYDGAKALYGMDYVRVQILSRMKMSFCCQLHVLMLCSLLRRSNDVVVVA